MKLVIIRHNFYELSLKSPRIVDLTDILESKLKLRLTNHNYAWSEKIRLICTTSTINRFICS